MSKEFIFLFSILCIHVWLWVLGSGHIYSSEAAYWGQERKWALFGARITGSYEIADVGTKNWTQVLCESTMCS